MQKWPSLRAADRALAPRPPNPGARRRIGTGCDLDVDSAASTAHLIVSAGGAAMPFQMDVTDGRRMLVPSPKPSAFMADSTSR